MVHQRARATTCLASRESTHPQYMPLTTINPTQVLAFSGRRKEGVINIRIDPLSKSFRRRRYRKGTCFYFVFSPLLSINKSGRPDIAAIITDIVSKADSYDRIAVVACGPDGMVHVARKTVAKNIWVDGPSLELYCEQFGW
jgi:hypothetical protein